ncbi:hypothetical protein V9T40_013869 [Parthenolecanium corni]|uniref:C2H2-type domain-containing protein n=1 Tax=Parthenolecanium corni TaxID=536013 RepID=A0AAN9TDG1_9HEMI
MAKRENIRSRKLSLDEKIEILNTLEDRTLNITEVCQLFGISKAAIATIQSNRRKLFEKFKLSDRSPNFLWFKGFEERCMVRLNNIGRYIITIYESNSTDVFRCVTCNEEFVSEVDLQKHKSSHVSSNGVKSSEASMNGNINNEPQSIANDSFGTDEQNSNDENAELNSTLSSLEEKLSDEKIIADDFLMNVGNDGNSFEIVDDDQFPFPINDDDPIPESYMDEDSNDNVATGEGEHENEGEVDGQFEDEDENDVDTGEDNHMNNDSSSTFLGGESNTSENASESDRMSENEQETEEASTRLPRDDISQETTSIAGESSLAAVQSEINDQSEAENVDQRASFSDIPGEDHEKENEKEDDAENTEARRPSSRESVTSTASSSSDRTLIIRSASQVNKIVPDSSDVVVKSEKVPQDRPAISILNPDQLGATSGNVAGENLLNNAPFAQSADPMLDYNMTSSLQDGSPALQCDVCETTFADGLILEEHRASAGHYKCHCSPECASYVFQTVAELSSHQQTLHGIMPQSPVQQLQHQVQNLRYQMAQPVGNNYQTMSQYQPGTISQSRSVVPSMYPNSQSSSQRQYVPRIQPNSVRGAVPMGNQVLQKRPPAAIQPQRYPPPKRRCLDNFPTRNGDADCKVVSIQKPDNCDDVVAQLSKSITITARQENQKMNETAAVANMLANRGITVSSVPSKQNRNSNAVAMLNLNSAVSLIPTNANNKGSSFAVPQGRISSGRPVANPVPGRMQTVDLTGPDPPRNKLMNRTAGRFTCQICDRTFINQDQLNQHLITHRGSPRKQLPFRCNVCSAQYPNQQSLMQHRQTCRRDAVSGTNEMVIPIVDLKQPGALQRLQSIGFSYMIPLNALGSQSSNGTFGIPILPFSSDRNTINNMTNCGISNILPVGPLKALGR